MKSLAIRASAGTGKTYELTLQYIARLSLERDPAALLATTFTRKAAGEILARIIGRLAEASLDGSSADKLRREIVAMYGDGPYPADTAGWKELLALCCRSLHRLNVSTIDALFVRLLAGFLPDLGYPVMPSMADEQSAEAVKARVDALEDTLAKLDYRIVAALLGDLFGGRAVRDVIRRTELAIGSLYDLAVSTSPSAWGNVAVLPPMAEGEVAAAIEGLLAMADACSNKLLTRGLITSAQDASVNDWMNVLNRGASAKVADMVLPVDRRIHGATPVYNRQAIPSEAVELLATLCRAAAHHFGAELAARSRAMRTILDHFADRYSEALRQCNLLPFAEAARAIAEHPDVVTPSEAAYRLGLAIGHLLLDEFQDTNRAQWSVLRHLFLQGSSTKRASVFCVGDIKQAIYGWRGGCAGIFDTLAEQLPDLLWDRREKSYRSSQIVLDTVNRVFMHLQDCPGLAEYPGVLRLWSERYLPHEAACDRPGYVALIQPPSDAEPDAVDVEPYVLDPSGTYQESAPTDPEDQQTAGARRSLYWSWVAQRIAELVAQHPTRSIGVLVRTNRAAGDVAYGLQTHGVAASIEGPGNLADDPATELILSAMLLADHPGSNAEAFHVLQSPLRMAIRLRDLSFSERCRASHRLRHALAVRGYTSVVAQLAHLLSPYGGPRTARRLTQLLQATSEYEARATSRPADYVRWIRSQVVHDATDAPLRIMTIHQAKGLQFDVVVAPDLSTRIHAADPPVIEQRDRETDPPHTVIAYPGRFARKAVSAAQEAYAQHQEREMAEALNVLYVLMTRAAHALHMIVPARTTNKDGSFRKVPPSFEAILRSALANETQADTRVLYEHGNALWDQDQRTSEPSAPEPERAQLATVPRIVFGRKGRRRHWPEASPSELNVTETRSVRELLRLDTSAAQQGALLHAWFQAIEWLDAGVPDDDDLIRLGREALPYAHPDWIRDRIPLFRRSLLQQAVQSVFRRYEGVRELWRERSFVVRMGDSVVRGRVDRLVVADASSASPRITITDFKSDSIGVDAVQERAQHYDAQMRSYALAVGHMLHAPLSDIRAQLLFVVPGVLHEISMQQG